MKFHEQKSSGPFATPYEKWISVIIGFHANQACCTRWTYFWKRNVFTLFVGWETNHRMQEETVGVPAPNASPTGNVGLASGPWVLVTSRRLPRPAVVSPVFLNFQASTALAKTLKTMDTVEVLVLVACVCVCVCVCVYREMKVPSGTVNLQSDAIEETLKNHFLKEFFKEPIKVSQRTLKNGSLRNHIWFHKEPFKWGFFKEPFP